MKNSHLALIIFAIPLFMLGASYAAVPLYDAFCRAIGLGGTTQTAKEAPQQIFDRTIKVTFNTDTDSNLPWKFQAEQQHIDIKIGENKLVFFRATNESNEDVVGTSIYNVTPAKAGQFFNKIECFCFEEQMIKAGETIRFPVSFFIDPVIMEKKNLDDLTTITLSYTFFKVKDPENY